MYRLPPVNNSLSDQNRLHRMRFPFGTTQTYEVEPGGELDPVRITYRVLDFSWEGALDVTCRSTAQALLSTSLRSQFSVESLCQEDLY
jgi:hypothetical protein